jgi:hypothetical protein
VDELKLLVHGGDVVQVTAHQRLDQCGVGNGEDQMVDARVDDLAAEGNPPG